MAIAPRESIKSVDGKPDGTPKIDAWANVLTALGTQYDKRMQSEFVYDPMGEMECEALAAGDDVAAAIVSALPDDAIRQWLKCSTATDGLSDALDKHMDVLNVPKRLQMAWEWGRQYGGAALLINVDDMADLSEPLDLARVRKLKSFTPFTRYELIAKDIEGNIDSDMYGRPLTYQLQPAVSTVMYSGQVIHHSRLIIFEGVQLPRREYIRNQYWGDSVLNRVKNAIRNYQTVNDAAATILQEFNQGVFSMEQLADLLGSGEDGKVIARLSMIQRARSICRAVVIDNRETFTNVAATVTGIPDMLDRVEGRLVVASRMPHTKLLGQSPSGLGATGNSEQRNWHDFVSNQQELELRPKIARILEIICADRSGPTRGKAVPDLGFEFNPLEQPNESEIVQNRKVQAEADKIYLEYAVLSASEVAVSRFGTAKYSFDTQIDPKQRDRERDELPPPVEDN